MQKTKISAISKWLEHHNNCTYPENKGDKFCSCKRSSLPEMFLKETRNSSEKWPLNLWWISNKTIMAIGNVSKAATFKSFLHQSYKNKQLLFFVTVIFTYFMRQTLTNNFLELHKNKNCAFPLRKSVLKICSKFTREHLSWSAISIKLLSIFGMGVLL